MTELAATTLTDDRWGELLACSGEFTCYSAAVATWAAAGRGDWRAAADPGLWLTITEAGKGLFGFAYYPPSRRAALGLARRGADDRGDAVDGVMAELARSGRVIIAADGFGLPWHVAQGRQHLPHWFVLLAGEGGKLEVADPFACRNALGNQQATRHGVAAQSLPALLAALPGGDPVHRLRERLALGDDADDPALRLRHQWLVAADVTETVAPDGADGGAGVRVLAAFLRDHGQDPDAYRQADDIWSIARHRAFLHTHALARAEASGEPAVAAWVEHHGEPLAKRWGHLAPLMMQATLALDAGRGASTSVADTLDALADMEEAAAQAAAESGTIPFPLAAPVARA
jgi:hypothetical protein